LQRGENIKRLRREAEATITVEDLMPGCEERVISVVVARYGGLLDPAAHSSGDALVALADSIMGAGDEGAACEIKMLVDSSREPQLFSCQNDRCNALDFFFFVQIYILFI
jgi:hypothetical protein